MTNHRYRELDSIRGIAALMVVLFHLTMGRDEANLGFKLGTTGVDLFFLISGFVIAVSISNVNSGVSFVINRASRLYPTYWVCVTLTFLVISAYAYYREMPIHWLDYLANLTMFQYYMNIKDLDGPYWTLIIEMLFYGLILLLYSTHVLKHIKYIGLLIVLFVAFAVSFFWSEQMQSVFHYFPLLFFFPLFYSGILFYQIQTKQSMYITNIIFIAISISVQIMMFPFAGKSYAFISQAEYAGMLSFFCLVFFAFVQGRLQFIVIAPLVFLGRISFALYLTHQYIVNGHVLPFLIHRLQINFWIAAVLVCLPIAIVIATIITVFLGDPMTLKMKRTFNSKSLKHQHSGIGSGSGAN